MTREEAIEFIAQSVKSDVDMVKVADAIKAVEQEPKWIPVSEKLPEEFVSVLACFKSQCGMAQCVTKRIVDFLDGSTRWSGMRGQKPIAWMLLPKPYKPESEE